MQLQKVIPIIEKKFFKIYERSKKNFEEEIAHYLCSFTVGFEIIRSVYLVRGDEIGEIHTLTVCNGTVFDTIKI